MKLPGSLGFSLALAPLVALFLVAACDSDEDGATTTATAGVSPTSEATRTVTATIAPSASASATGAAAPTATPGPPHLERFAAGEVIDVAPAVVFVDPETGAAEAWVTPGAFPEVAVAPDGSYVVYQVAEGFRLLRTEDGADRTIVADSLPIELGPGGAGFVATTQDRFVVSAFDGRG
ncbi:MAG: hypothetical protein O3A10_09310 [Chloroflexi bacterium]|nr:hypothetical protein [Chloroflexota bacterium]MDA1146614.1 hypothetical protein [Chloroflexota bacterium]MQC82841.1 hypothetical protein [Chloroflexota bacterium]